MDDPVLKEFSWTSAWAPQFEAQVGKNYHTYAAKKITLGCILLLPFLYILLFWLLTSQVNPLETSPKAAHSAHNLGIILPCVSLNAKSDSISNPNCTLLVYAPRNETTDAIMASLAKDHGLKFGRDVVGVEDELALGEWMYHNIGRTSFLVLFEGKDEWSAPEEVRYKLIYNSTVTTMDQGSDSFDYTRGTQILAVQVAIDRAILSLMTGKTVVYDVKVTPFAIFEPKEKEVTANVLTMLVIALFIVISGSITSMVQMQLIAGEKRRKLLGFMRQMGLVESTYWLSWFVFVPVLAVLSACLVIIGGWMSDTLVFTECNFLVQLFLISSFFTAMTSLMFFIVSFCTRPRWVNLISFALLGLATVMHYVFAMIDVTSHWEDWTGGTLVKYKSFWNSMYSPDTSTFSSIMLWLMPFFHFGKGFSDIMGQTLIRGMPNAGAAYTFGNFTSDFGPFEDGDHEFYAPSTAMACVNLLLLSAMYMTLAWYMAQTAGSSSPKKMWFFLQPKFWSNIKPRTTMTEGDTIAQIAHDSRREQSIKIHKLTKSFPGCTAVKEMSLTMKSNEVFCLLGHNGAGKTTTISVLTGLESATHGEAYVCGLSVRTEMPLIQQLMGVCPQHDVLFENLTGKEHLQFWGKFHGVDRESLQNQVTSVLEDTSLTSSSDVLSSNYSGGMMRRLSVGIATMGHPKVLFLDEPTTGMDPLSKRKVWDMVRALKRPGRIIVLTTHSLEEADMLGDEIAIMSLGRLRALGSSLFLKSRFGSGHHVSLLTDDRNAKAVEKMVTDALPGCEIIDSTAGNITLSLPHNAARRLPAFFRLLESPDSMVNEWGVRWAAPSVVLTVCSNTTLEEVFLRLTAQNREVNQDLGRAEQSMCQICGVNPTCRVTMYSARGIAVLVENILCYECSLPEETAVQEAAESTEKGPTAVMEAPKKAKVVEEEETEEQPVEVSVKALSHKTEISTWMQFEGLLTKNFQLQIRQKRTMWCVGIFYGLFVLITVLTAMGGGGPGSGDDSGVTCPNGLKRYSSADCNPRVFAEWFMRSTYSSVRLDVDEGVSAATPKTNSDELQWPYNFSRPSEDRLQSWNSRGRYRSHDEWPANYNFWVKRFWYYEDYMASSSAGKKPLTDWNLFGRPGDKTGYPQRIKLIQKTTPLDDIVYASQQWVKASSGPLPNSTCGEFSWYEDDIADNDNKILFFDNLIDAFSNYSARFPDVAMNVLRSEPDDLDLSVQFFIPTDSFRYNDMWFENRTEHTCGFFEAEDQPRQLVGEHLAAAIHELSNGMLFTHDNWAELEGRPNRTIRTDLASFPWISGNNDNDEVNAFPLMSLTLISMLMLPTFMTFLVDERQLKLYNLLTMQGMQALPYWASAYTFYMTICSLGLMVYVGLNMAVGINAFEYHTIWMFLGCSLVWAHAQTGLAILLTALLSRRAKTLCFIMILFMVVSIPNFAQFLHDWPWELLVIPPTCAIRVISLLFSNTSQQDDFIQPLLYLGIVGALLTILGVYLHLVIPSKVGQRKHPLFFLSWFSRKQPRYDAVPLTTADHSHLIPITGEDEDVAAERELVAGTSPRDVPIRIHNLAKTYSSSPPKEAVKELSLLCHDGEVLGLLGPNGAGKSSLLHMLTGIISSTRGTAHVCGFEISEALEEIHQRIGMCPQFDVVWDQLTTRQHLHLFAKIKGIPRGEIFAVVQRVAEQVELDGDALDTQAAQLSGGTRRRLSLAICLLSSPRILFLDEPTTGLDAETRRSIWNIINRFKAGRCVILCTHSMEEADTLSTRIGIMANGELQCVGSQLHLKNRFGSGYELKISLESNPSGDYGEEDKKLLQFVLQLCPAAKLTYSFDCARTFSLPKGSVEVSTVFEELENHRARIGINVGVFGRAGLMEGQEYGLSHTSLEEVFCRIAKNAEEAQALSAAIDDV